MAIPLVGAAATAVARVVAKKLATRAVGGITGAGAKSVGPVYKEQGFSNAVLKQPSYTPTNSVNNPLVNDMLKQIKKGIPVTNATTGKTIFTLGGK